MEIVGWKIIQIFFINFGKTNNLRRKTGSPFLAKGDYLFIEGYLTDILNNPIENARIYIWQANMFGYYNHLGKM